MVSVLWQINLLGLLMPNPVYIWFVRKWFLGNSIFNWVVRAYLFAHKWFQILQFNIRNPTREAFLSHKKYPLTIHRWWEDTRYVAEIFCNLTSHKKKKKKKKKKNWKGVKILTHVNLGVFSTREMTFCTFVIRTVKSVPILDIILAKQIIAQVLHFLY